MLRAGDSALLRHRQALRIQTAPPGLVFQNFGKSAHQFFMHARVRVAPPPNNSASPPRSNQLAAPLNYCAASSPRHQLLTCTRKNMVCQKRPMAPAAPPPYNSTGQLRCNPSHKPRRPDSPPVSPPRYSSRVRAWERLDAVLLPNSCQQSCAAATLRVVDLARARVGPGAAKVVQIRKSVNL